ncbi:MAG: D-2-hydroxyacid dehydrogenase [Chloroflexota bacterium]
MVAEKTLEILITLPFTDELIAPLREVAPRANIIVHPARDAKEIPKGIWERVVVLYTHDVLPAPESVPKLKWIQCHWAGIDGLLKAPILYQEGIMVTTLSGAAVPQMGEYILMMMLALGHHLPALIANQAKTGWPPDRWERFAPVELSNSTVGIVGYGSLGREVARLLQAYGATVLATKRDAMQPTDKGYAPEGRGDPEGDFAHRLYPPEALCSMLKECDFVVITVPLTPETHNLIDESELKALKPTAFLVDVSRGGVVNLQALRQALESGEIAGAALDVFPQEPLLPDSPLWHLPNVIITPHISGVTKHYDERAIALFAANLERYLQGKPLFNLFNPQLGY